MNSNPTIGQATAGTELRAWTHAFHHSGLALVIFDPAKHQIVAVNRAFADRRGYAPDEMIGLDADLLYPSPHRPAWRNRRPGIDRQTHVVVESEHVTRAGERFPVLLDISVLHDSDGRPQRVVAYALDISERKRAQRELQLAEVAFQAQVPLVVTARQGAIERVNRAFVELTGYTDTEARGHDLSLLGWDPDDPQMGALRNHAAHGEAAQRELWLQTRDGSSKVVRLTVTAVTAADGSVDQRVWSLADLSAAHRARATVERLTFFDALTGLPNQRYLWKCLGSLPGCATDAPAAVLMLDLDRFRRVNDLYGHTAGDRLLVKFAERLQRATADCTAFARLGGGSFAPLVVGSGDAEVEPDALATEWAGRVRATLAEPFELGRARRVAMTVSIGWAAVPPHPESRKETLKQAEIAMYEAKAQGPNTMLGFDASMQESMEMHALIAVELENAPARGELALHLQPLVDSSGYVTGAEALLRWTRPEGHQIGPEKFIPIAEETGLIQAIGRWTLDRGCAQLAAWASAPATQNLALAINVSARQLADPGFVAEVRRALALTAAHPDHLKLEITETAVLANLEDATQKLAQLRAMGVKIALDDFGTGYSSLAHVASLPIDEIKIDRSFIARLPGTTRDAIMVEAVIRLAHRLELQVVVEGVETEAQRRYLHRIGCDAYQGYLFARAVPPDQFPALVGAINLVARSKAVEQAPPSGVGLAA